MPLFDKQTYIIPCFDGIPATLDGERLGAHEYKLFAVVTTDWPDCMGEKPSQLFLPRQEDPISVSTLYTLRDGDPLLIMKRVTE